MRRRGRDHAGGGRGQTPASRPLAAGGAVARPLARLPTGRAPVQMPRARPRHRPHGQHAVLHRVRVFHADVSVLVLVRLCRRRPRVIVERRVGLSADRRLVSHRLHIVSGGKNQTSGERVFFPLFICLFVYLFVGFDLYCNESSNYVRRMRLAKKRQTNK